MFCADTIGPLVKRVMRALGINPVQEKKWFIPEQTILVEYGEATFNSMPEPPSKIWVAFDGAVYECEAEYHVNGFVVNYGNKDGYGGENTGEPFWIQYNRTTSSLRVFDLIGDPLADSNEYTFGIYILEESTTPIDPKYLPEGFGGGGLTSIELETALADGTTQLSEADIAKLSAAMEAKMPVVIRLVLDEMTLASVFYYAGDDSSGSFIANHQGREILLANMVGTWMAIVQ